MIVSKAKATQLTAPMNHSRTGESTHYFNHHLLFLETDLITAWSALGPEE